MKTSKVRIIILGAVTLVPAIYFLVFLASLALTAIQGPISGTEPFVFRHFGLFMLVHICTMLLNLGLMIYYMVFVFKSDVIKKDMKVLWAVVLFFGNMIAMPIFWYLYFWKLSLEK